VNRKPISSLRLSTRTRLTIAVGVRICVGALVVRHGCVLLGRRSGHKTYAHCWDLPGGHQEIGETLEKTLRRELKEELGIVPIEYILHSTHEENSVRLHLFVVSRWLGRPRRCGDEHSEIRWYKLSTACVLPDLAAQAYVNVFQSLQSVVSRTSQCVWSSS
jgi:8-oxo-dGTP diphosphatase